MESGLDNGFPKKMVFNENYRLISTFQESINIPELLNNLLISTDNKIEYCTDDIEKYNDDHPDQLHISFEFTPDDINNCDKREQE
jgi:hypothetical protein